MLLGGKSGPSHPDHWDPRIAPIAQWVARERKLPFLHPVYVDFLTPAQYHAASTTSEDDLTPEDKAALDQFAGAWRAVGLAEGKVDLGSSMNDVSDTGTLAFYNPDDERVRVRGTKLTPGVRVTLAHELTHALQDQHFDLKDLYNDSSRCSPTATTRSCVAVVEGDAEDIEQRYVERAADLGGAARRTRSSPRTRARPRTTSSRRRRCHPACSGRSRRRTGSARASSR